MNLETLNTSYVDECLKLAASKFGRSFEYKEVRYDLRGRAAGQLVSYKSNFRRQLPSLRFNPLLLERYQQAFIDTVVPHECAHLVAYEVYGRKIRPHGVEWKYVMTEVYAKEPEVTHQFEIEPARRLNSFSYYCGCSDRQHRLTSIRHNRVQRGKARYLCKECRTVLAFGGAQSGENT